MTKKILTLTGVFIYTLPLFAGSLSVKVDNQTLVAKVCNLPKGTTAVNFKADKQGFTVADKNFDSNGCAIQKLDAQMSGKSVSASYKKGTEDVKMEAVAPVLAGGSATPAQPAKPAQTTPAQTAAKPSQTAATTTAAATQQQAAVTLKEINADKVEDMAEQSANFFANRVVETYGRVENYRINFYRGFNKTAQLYANLGLSTQNLPAYQSGLSKGSNDGFKAGNTAGYNQANADGSSTGSSLARQRFQNALGNPAALDVSNPSIPDLTKYAGLNSNKTDPSLNQILGGYDSKYLDEARISLALDNDIEFDDELRSAIYGSRWNLAEYYGWKEYQCEIPQSILGGGKAFGLFLGKRFVRENSGNANMVKDNAAKVQKYREITDPAEYKNAEKNASIYQSKFMKQYNKVIDDKWIGKVCNAQNQAAQERGVFYFTQAINQYAFTAGENRGFSSQYTNASRKSYVDTLPGALLGGFSSTVDTHSKSAVVEVSDLSLLNQDGSPTFSVIDSIVPVIKKAVNLGKVNGNIQIQLSGAQVATQTTATTPIAALSAISSPIKLSSAGQVTVNALPNSQIDVGISINGRATGSKITVSWSQTVKQASVDSAQRQQMLIQYIAKHLGQEMANAKKLIGGEGVNYQKNYAASLLAQFITTYNTLPAEGKANLDKFKADIANSMGKKPGFCIACGKDDWEVANKALISIGWKLP